MKHKVKTVIFLFLLSFLAGETQAGSPIKIIPNPWVPEGEKVRTGNLTTGQAFTNLPSSGEILIYTIQGELVKKIGITGAVPGTEKWYGKNDDGQDVASGVYLWVVKGPDFTKTGKLMVIR
jgi:hypothetical protein